jgi:hypothetical protein
MANKYDITIEQGASFDLNLAVKTDGVLNNYTSGWTAKAQGRVTFGSSATTFSTADSGCQTTLAATSPNVALTMTPVYTAALTAPAVGVYDIELTHSGGGVTRLLEGEFTITPEVTKI